MEALSSQKVADKIFELTEQFNRYVFNNPDILNDIPEKAVLVFLDAEDAAFNRASVSLAHATPSVEDAPLVYVRMQKKVRVVRQVEWRADIVASPFIT